MKNDTEKISKAQFQLIYDRDNRAGLSYLWKLSHQALTIHSGLVGYYMNLFQRLSILSEAKIDQSNKSKYCQCCGVIFVSGLTCLMKTKKGGRVPSKTTFSLYPCSEVKVESDKSSSSLNNDVSIHKFTNRIYNLSGLNNKKRKRTSDKIKIKTASPNLVIYSCLNCKAKTCISGLIKYKDKSTKNKKLVDIPDSQKVSQKEKISLDSSAEINPKPESTKNIKKESKKAKKNKTSKIYLAKGTFKPASVKPGGNKKNKMNLGKLLENEKKAKSQEKSSSQAFSLGDFLKKINN